MHENKNTSHFHFFQLIVNSHEHGQKQKEVATKTAE
jgi:hypothetical protein